MKKYVFTVKDDVCVANGKDIAATELIEKMKLYGTVEDYDRAIASVRAEYQTTVDNLTAQNVAMKDHNLTSDELEIVKGYRIEKAKVCAGYESRIGSLETELKDIRIEEQMRSEKILAILGANT